MLCLALDRLCKKIFVHKNNIPTYVNFLRLQVKQFIGFKTGYVAKEDTLISSRIKFLFVGCGVCRKAKTTKNLEESIVRRFILKILKM